MQKIVLSLLVLLTLPALAMEEEHPVKKQLSPVEQYELNQDLRNFISWGHFSSALDLLDADKVDVNANFLEWPKELMRNGKAIMNHAHICSSDSMDNMPLSHAMRANPSMCSLLLKRHARIDTKNKNGLPMLALAAMRSNPQHDPNAMKIYPSVLSSLITDSRFDPRISAEAQQESQNRIWTALLCLKRCWPNMLKDIKRLLLLGNYGLRCDALNCPMGLCKDLIHEMPMPIARTLIKNGSVTKAHVLNRLTEHKLACLRSLMSDARQTIMSDPESLAILDPELLNELETPIRGKIEQHLAIADPSLLERTASTCSVQ